LNFSGLFSPQWPRSATCFAPKALETIRRLSARRRLLASVNQRSAEAMGGLPASLDRFAAIDGCLVAVEKGLLADNFGLCLDRVGAEKLGVRVPNGPEDIAAWLARPIRQITTDRPEIALDLR
jgi:glycerophosphoryl diester phosphodiesterase